jgi:hypothetical protein
MFRLVYWMYKSKLSAEQNGALESFDKMNVLAFKLNETNKEQFESERRKLFWS